LDITRASASASTDRLLDAQAAELAVEAARRHAEIVFATTKKNRLQWDALCAPHCSRFTTSPA
jgi:hypothetical protein